MYKSNAIWGLNQNVYSLTINNNASGTATSDTTIGTENYQTNLYATPIQGAKLSGWNVTGGTVNNNVFTFGNTDATIEPVFEESLIPDMNVIQSGYVPNIRQTSFYWYIPRTTRFLNGEMPYIAQLKYGSNSTTQIFAIKQIVDNGPNDLSFTAKLKYQQVSNPSRTNFGNSNSSNYLTRRATMQTFTGIMGYSVLQGGVQQYTSNPFDGDWQKGDEGALFNMTIEEDDLGYIIGNEVYERENARTCECEKSAYYFTTKPNEFLNLNVGDTISVDHWTNGTAISGNVLHCSQSNFGWWWD